MIEKTIVNVIDKLHLLGLGTEIDFNPQLIVNEPITLQEAEEIHQDYLSHLDKVQDPIIKEIRTQSFSLITPDLIREWSRNVYWGLLNQAEQYHKGESMHYAFARSLCDYVINQVGDHKDGLVWTAQNLHLRNIRKTFPGLLSEYIRRHYDLENSKSKWDNVSHFVFAAAYTTKYTPQLTSILGTLDKKLDFFLGLEPLSHVEEDMLSNSKGILYAQRIT